MALIDEILAEIFRVHVDVGASDVTHCSHCGHDLRDPLSNDRMPITWDELRDKLRNAITSVLDTHAPEPSRGVPDFHGSDEVVTHVSDVRLPEWSDEQIARLFHEAYERLAPDYNYKTRTASAVPWDEVPENNRKLMIAVASEVRHSLKPEPQPQPHAASDYYRILKRLGLENNALWDDIIEAIEGYGTRTQPIAPEPQPTGDIAGLLDDITDWLRREIDSFTFRNTISRYQRIERKVDLIRKAVAELQAELKLSEKMLADKCNQHMEAETKVLELRAVSERLEWLAENLFRIDITKDILWGIDSTDGPEFTVYGLDTLNDAIDAAMQWEADRD